MKILQIVDSPTWAISHLAAIPVKHNPHLEFQTLYVHPKEVTPEAVEMVRQALPWADIVDLQYWRTASQLLEALPELRAKKLMLTHHNQKDLLSYDWKDINLHVVHTRRAQEVLIAEGGYDNVIQIAYGFNLDYFTYNEDYDASSKVVGYCGRIVPWKGLKEIARACYELGYPLKVMGKMDKPSYWAEIPSEHQANIDVGYMNSPDEDRLAFYRDIGVFVANSGPNHEEGTMPLQEAMACGVPVVTTPAGVAEDIIDDQQNGIITPFGDYDALKANIKMLVENSELRERLRSSAWKTIKTNTEERMAWDFEAAYHKLYSKDPLVSVIIPATLDRKVEVSKILSALEFSDYKHFEVIIGYDQIGKLILEKDFTFSFPLKHVFTEKIGGYNLAMSRNLAVCEAQGEYLFFCDSRMEPAKEAITAFMFQFQQDPKAKVWLFGEKGGNKNSFVENFSFIRKDYFVRMGMMNERINRYGGMSQELRTRAMWQGFKLLYVPDAKAVQLSGTHLTAERKKDIIKSKLLLWKLGIK